MSLKELARKVRDSLNIVEVVSEHISLKKVGRNYVGLCPFHSETKPSFTVSEEKQIFRCFGCGVGGDVIAFYAKINGLDFVEAVKELAERAGIDYKLKDLSSKEDRKKRELIEINERAARYFRHLLETSPEAEEAREYLRERGIDKETSKEFFLGYAPSEGSALVSHFRLLGLELSLVETLGLVAKREDGSFYDRFRGRIIFPIRDLSGAFVGFGGRILAEGDPKYLNTPESPVFNKGRLLYGFYEAKVHIRAKDEALLVEGYFDVLSLWQHGIRNAVASCGTALTKDHLKLMKRFTKNWFLVFDGDEAGRKAALRAIRICYEEGIFPKVVFLPEGEDPDSLVRKKGPEAFLELKDRATSSLEFAVSYLVEVFGRSAEGKSVVASELRELLSVIPDPVVQYEYRREAARRLAVPENYLVGKRRWVSERREDGGINSFERSLLLFAVHCPESRERLEELGVEEFLETPAAQKLYKALKGVEEEFFDPEVQELYSDLVLSPAPDGPPEKVLQEIRRALFRERLRREMEAIRGREDLFRISELFSRLKTISSGEGAYEPHEK